MLFYSGCRIFCRPLMRCLFSIDCNGLEYVPKQGGVILCSNHRRLTDPPLLGCLFPRPIRYMAKSELFTDHGRLPAFFLKQYGAFPVKRDNADPTAVKTAVSLLEAGEIVGIFPEGGIRKEGTPFEARAGVAMLAQKAKAPILPVWIEYGTKSGLRQPVKVRIGKLLPHDDAVSHGRKTIREMTAQITEVMNALGGV